MSGIIDTRIPTFCNSDKKKEQAGAELGQAQTGTGTLMVAPG